MELVNCPCCGFPTLGEPAAYLICRLCNWEDDGQGDLDANEVWGGPNGSYSLSEARENFKKFRTMYHPDDSKINRRESFAVLEVKEKLIEAYSKLNTVPQELKERAVNEIFKLEKLLS